MATSSVPASLECVGRSGAPGEALIASNADALDAPRRERRQGPSRHPAQAVPTTVAAQAFQLHVPDHAINEMDTVFGDGSKTGATSGLMRKLLGASKRLVTGESLVTTLYRNESQLKRRVAFAAPYPGRIVPIKLAAMGAQAQALAAVARQVVGDDAASYRFHLADDKMVNAFAVPGGDIVVNRGLLTATRSPEELAGVLAHEIQHVALRHSLQGVVRGAGLSLLFAIVIGDASATLAGQAADRLLGLKFSRDAEREADEHGFGLLLMRGINPHGMVAFFATLAKQGGATPATLLSTHPTSAEREAALATRLKKMPANCCEPLVIDGAWPPR